VERSSRWFARRGARVIILSRFLPGTRLPTYFAAGLFETSLVKFSLYFLLAAAVWTPLLVGVSMLAGAEAARAALASGEGAVLRLVAAGLLVLVVVRLSLRLSSRRGRRLFAARLGRLARWEFWPPWMFYPPVVLYVLWLALKHRSLTLFTCANPAIPAGGFAGESKFDILRGLASSEWARARVARAALVPATLSIEARLGAARAFMREEKLDFPVVVKPDVGQRGEGVVVARSAEELMERLASARGDSVVQEHVAGREFGVFYYRLPGERRGHILSITDKRFPAVVGDSRSTLEELILGDERARLMARAYFERNRARLDSVPAAGEGVTLVEIGSHCRGALFLDGADLLTPELEEEIDRLSRGFRGFHFGRYDLRAPSAEDFRRGLNLKVIELNGVTSEATSIYDPRHGLTEAYRTLFRQWRTAFQIGARNRARGHRPTPLSTLVRLTARNFLRAAEGGAPRAGAPHKAGGNISCEAGI
jgi:hypothetical protein